MSDENIDEKTRSVANLLKALSHPVRLAMVKTLIDKSRCPHGCHPCKCGDKCEGRNCKCGCKCGEFVEIFPMAQATVSQHIKELKKVGLIELSGRKADYTLNHSKLSEGLMDLLNLLNYNDIRIMEETKCNCGEKCQCGDDCQYGDGCNCKTGGECTCGDDCQCGEGCNCKTGGECTCGDDCQCGDDCNCKTGGECTCGDDCQCGEGCNCKTGGECTCGDDCKCND